jgi:hypothetical protein
MKPDKSGRASMPNGETKILRADLTDLFGPNFGDGHRSSVSLRMPALQGAL